MNTHWHFDHAGGNAEMAKAGVRIVAHENCRKRLATGQYMEALDRRMPAAPHAALPLITLTQETALHLNGEDIRLIPVAPAHTDGDVIVRFEKANVVHMGDLFFHGMYPFIDYSSGGWLGGMAEGAKTGLTLCDARTKIMPGHGAVAGKADLEGYLKLLETILGRLLKLKDAGRSADEAVAAAPTKDFDEKLGGGFLDPEKFVRIAYTGLLKHGR